MTFKRQNDDKALIFLRASAYCDRHEKAAKYVILISSIILCLVGIFNKYYMFLEQLPFIANQDNPSQSVTLWIAMLSGSVMIFQAFLSIRTHRLGIEKNNFLEMYDNYVYNIPSNTLLMRSISGVIIENYARKVKNKRGRFNNFYFATVEESEKKNAIFENQFKIFMNDYKLLLYVRGYYLAIWIMFFVGILVISANFNDKFVNTLVNTMIPSLSIILLIVKSWHSLNEQLRYLQNCTSKLETMEKNNIDEQGSLNSRTFIRSVQDAVFSYRKSDFLVPQFAVKMFWKNQRKGMETMENDAKQVAEIAGQQATATESVRKKYVVPKAEIQQTKSKEKTVVAKKPTKSTTGTSKTSSKTTKKPPAKTDSKTNK